MRVVQLIIISVLLIFINGCSWGIGWKAINIISTIGTGYIKHRSDKMRDVAIMKDLDRIKKELEAR